MAHSRVTLADGVTMPIIGFGTWQLDGSAAYDALRHALDAGYRHIDTATMYGNERQVGRAVRNSGVDREQIFVTTKLPPDRAGRERETIAASLRDLGTDYVDLWLVHWPPRGRARPETWQRFIEARTDGLARAIGVSNYSSAQIDELITTTGVTPAVDQIRWGPTLYDPVRAAELARRGVVLEGYSPFKSSDLHEPLLSAVADRHGVTAAQVILRWHIEHGVAVIPKSANPARIQANIDVFGFRLTDDEIASIDRLGG